MFKNNNNAVLCNKRNEHNRHRFCCCCCCYCLSAATGSKMLATCGRQFPSVQYLCYTLSGSARISCQDTKAQNETDKQTQRKRESEIERVRERLTERQNEGETDTTTETQRDRGTEGRNRKREIKCSSLRDNLILQQFYDRLRSLPY